MIDISALRRALATLQVGLDALAKAPGDAFVRDACIQRFEYSHELTHKMPRRYREATEPAGVAALSFPELVRLGFARGLPAQGWDVWGVFRAARNMTSHAYDQAKADELMKTLPEFGAVIAAQKIALWS